jgi:hypothetical protein
MRLLGLFPTLGTALLIIAGCGLLPRVSPPAAPPSSAIAIPPPAAVGSITSVERMMVPRAVATATRLADGRVLVAGGCTTNGCDLGSPGGATAELFDPSTESFTATGGLTISRDDHAALRLPDGRVMLIGGWGPDGVLPSTDIYDPAAGAFTRGPDMHARRSGEIPVELADGRILLAGGFIDNRPTIRSAEVLDPVTLTFTPTGDLSMPRGAYAAARLPDGRVLLAGGLSDGVVTATAEVYDPAHGSFSPTGSMSMPRYKGGALTLADGRVLVFGGSGDIDGSILYDSTEVYDPASGTFRPGPIMLQPRYKLAESTIRLGSGDYLVAAGAHSPEHFDATRVTFAPVVGSLGATRLFLAAAAIDEHRVLLVGGYDRAITVTDQAWIYDDRR